MGRAQSIFASVWPTIKYILRRLLYMVPVLFIISVILFVMVVNMPGNPALAYLDPEATGEMANLANIEEQLGLNAPIYIRYLKWVGNLLQGNFGYSSAFRKSISSLMPYYLRNTLMVNITAFILAFIFAIVIGIKCAVKRYSFFDNFFTVFSLFGISMPGFLMAMLLIFAFVIIIPIFPFSGMVDPRLTHTNIWSYTLDVMYHMVLPVMVTTLGSIASTLRYVRNAMLEVLKADYIRTARAKGLKDKVVIYRHAFRNALIPVITLVGLSIPGLFSGSLIVEKIFTWPGIGYLMSFAYTNRDHQVILALNIIYAIITLVANLLVDIAYSFADPRVRVGGGSNE